MKVCPTCQKQYPNGFQYCPNDTELLLTAEEYLRRTLPVSTPIVAPAITRVDPPAPPAPLATEKLAPERLPERLAEPLKDSPSVRVSSAVPVSPTPPPAQPATQPITAPLSAQSFTNQETAKLRQNNLRSTTTVPVVSVEKPSAPGATPPASARTGSPVATGAANGAAVGVGGMSFLLPEQGGVFRQVSEGFGVFFKYFGKTTKSEGSAALFDERSLLARIKEGFSLFFQYFGQKAQAGGDEFLVPEAGSIVTRLRESFRIFVDDFGKKPPELIPGQMGLLPDEPILKRFGRELKIAGTDFKQDPRAFVKSFVKGDGSTHRRQRLMQVGVGSAVIAYAFIFVAFLLGGLINFGKVASQEKEPELELQTLIVPTEPPTKNPPKEAPKGKGGFTGGSKPKPQQAHGGGGGGREEPKPPSVGRPPQMAMTPPIIPPDPQPPKITNPKLPVPATLYGDPKALPKMTGPIGDPKGIQGPPSSGPGSGDGIGTGKGTGVGPGDGGGFGQGKGGNAGGGDMGLGGGPRGTGSGGVMDMGRDGVGRIVIVYKEKARYTEEARQNKVQGTVVLSAVFTSDGRVTQVRVIRGLPDGLTEKAIEAAQKIKFQPATKQGQAVTVRGQLEFTFNLY